MHQYINQYKDKYKEQISKLFISTLEVEVKKENNFEITNISIGLTCSRMYLYLKNI